MQPPEPDDEPRRLADHLLEYAREPMLWPVLIVAVAIFVTLGTAVLLAGLFARNLFALAALLLLGAVSADAVIRELRSRGFGPVSGGLLALWGLSAACAVGIVATGWY